LTPKQKRFDILTVGRCAVDFYCNDVPYEREALDFVAAGGGS
jgi:hypothetical protein